MIATTDESNLIIIVAVTAIISTIALSFSSALPGFLTVIFGILLVGVTPGFGWTYAILPKKNLVAFHRLFMSVPLSIAITATSAFIISAYLHVAWTPLTVRLVLLAIGLAGSAVALTLHRKNSLMN